MRTYLFMMILSCFTYRNACGQHTIADVDWLQGNWKRADMKTGRTGIETWADQDSVLVGKGITLSDGDTIFIEKLRIVMRSNTLHYVADIKENVAPIYFKFISLTRSSFVCENLSHDFPKRIAYTLDGDKLKATISGNGKSINYWFERLK